MKSASLTCKQIIDEDGELMDGFETVHREVDDSWRHGCYITQVFCRVSDDTYWQARYRLSSNGETDELSERIASIEQVEAFQEMVTKYRPSTKVTAKPPAGDPQTLILVRFEKGFGRMGNIDGLLIIARSDLEASYGKCVHFGEVLGKHSDISVTLDASMFTVVSEEADFISKLASLLGTSVSGFNPFDYFEDSEEDEEDEE